MLAALAQRMFMDVTPEEVEDFVNGQFAQKLCDATAWFGHARALIASARISKESAAVLISHTEKSELENVCSFLYGLALENLFKAIWIHRKFGSPWEEDWLPQTKFPKEIQTHDLKKLAEKVDPKLVEKYDFSLELLTECVFQTKVATDSRRSLPPIPRESCH
jgi:hypothetical protein